MAPSMSVRFTGGPAVPTVVGETPSPGELIATHLMSALPRLGVAVVKREDIQYAHELECQVGSRVYRVCVAYDWVQVGWWEVFWGPTLGFLGKLRGQSEDAELARLASAISSALDSLPGIQQRRWYTTYSASTKAGAPFSQAPAL